MIETMKETRRIWLYSKNITSEKLYDEHLQISLAIKQQNEELAKHAMASYLCNVEKVFETTESISEALISGVTSFPLIFYRIKLQQLPSFYNRSIAFHEINKK